MARIRGAGKLLFLFLHFYGFEILRLEDLMAIQTFNVVNAVSPGDHLGALVVTRGLHKARVR